GGDIDDAAPQADGVFLRQPGTAAVVLTADCLPLVLADRSGGAIAVVHAGWRGLAAGILETALAAFQVPADEIVVTLGPCILPRNFEVGADVRATFLHRFGREAATAFLPRSGGRWYGMLARLAYLRLKALGVSCVVGFGVTQAQSSLSHCNPFYSYRAAQTTGRFATVVGIFDA
ncbi:MAG: polyphenol oxidase family protein, partial [Gammaproteobacteria bacterium]